ncbi:MAG: STAS domain-containing protein [Candidatus Aceula meridiana]|nr:STAS domain-containing protein [Candidatus Aceula meridiana]
MNIKQEQINDVVVCVMDGEINISNSPELRKFFDDVLKTNTKKVIFDFSFVPYIDSSGLATLIEMFQRLKKVGGALRLCSMSEKIKNIFELTKLTKLFDISETRENALKDF